MMGGTILVIIDENLNPVVAIISHVNKIPGAVHRNSVVESPNWPLPLPELPHCVR